MREKSPLEDLSLLIIVFDECKTQEICKTVVLQESKVMKFVPDECKT